MLLEDHRALGARLLLEVQVLLRVRDLDPLGAQAHEDCLEDRVHRLAAVFRVLDPHEQLEIEARRAKGAEAHARLGVLAHQGVRLGDLEEDSPKAIDVGVVGDPHGDAQPHLGARPSRLVDDLRSTDDGVGDRELDVVARDDPGRAQPDARHLTTCPTRGAVQDDVVTNPVRGVGDDEDSGEEVREGVLRRETDREGRDACARQRDQGGQLVEQGRHSRDQELDLIVQAIYGECSPPFL